MRDILMRIILSHRESTSLVPYPTESDIIALSQLVEGNPLATIVIDSQHRVMHWNRACALLTGIDAEAMIGHSEHWRAFYPEPRPILADLIVDHAMEGEVACFYDRKFKKSQLIEGAWEAEDYFPNCGNEGRWLYFTAAAIRDADGEIVGAIETLQDVTARRRAEAALRDSTVFQSQVINGSSVATLVIDADHRVTHWNYACEILTGIEAGDVIGTDQHWRAFYAKIGRAHV